MINDKVERWQGFSVACHDILGFPTAFARERGLEPPSHRTIKPNLIPKQSSDEKTAPNGVLARRLSLDSL